MILRPYLQTDDEGMREGSELLFLVLEVLCRCSGPTPQTDDGGMTEDGAVDLVDGGVAMILRPYPTKELWRNEEGAGAVDLGDAGVVRILRPYSETDDGGMREDGAVDLVDGSVAMILRPYPTKELWRNEEGAGLVVHGDGCVVMILRTYSQTDAGRMREGKREILKE
ncbi:hypothetical protein TNCV_3310391 [Trichonephila clavipes]|uniref:Uncharacterized protein n=1 Tax=Trichonephila clavipes TaxID=2585209 RepID=A0A8X6S9M1_TRICX|nr:hypothetical protein TNCV_3310391 [Trichonephila clavipes]